MVRDEKRQNHTETKEHHRDADVGNLPDATPRRSGVNYFLRAGVLNVANHPRRSLGRERGPQLGCICSLQTAREGSQGPEKWHTHPDGYERIHVTACFHGWAILDSNQRPPACKESQDASSQMQKTLQLTRLQPLLSAALDNQIGSDHTKSHRFWHRYGTRSTGAGGGSCRRSRQSVGSQHNVPSRNVLRPVRRSDG